MLTRYGFAAIYIDGVEYKLSPTFQNIDKLGTPEEIIETVKSLYNCPSFNWQYHRALEVVQACCEPKLPEKFTGRFKTLENGKIKLVNPPSADFIHDITVLALHCIKHGVMGFTGGEGGGDGDPLKEFDAYFYMGLAQEHLSKTREQSADMTMTEFLMLWDIKFPESKKEREEKARKAKSLNALMEYQKELDEKATQKRAAKSKSKQV